MLLPRGNLKGVDNSTSRSQERATTFFTRVGAHALTTKVTRSQKFRKGQIKVISYAAVLSAGLDVQKVKSEK